MVQYFAGLDLGQSQDYTALCVIEQRARQVLRLRYLERVPLGTAYMEVVQRVRRTLRSRRLAGERYLAVDATGVGRPVVELLKQAELGCRVWPVLITGAGEAGARRGVYRVPKRELIVGLQGLLERGELRIAAGLGAGEALVRELGEMRVRVTGKGHEQFGVWRRGEHDDLVLAVALGCWAAERARRSSGRGAGERNGRPPAR